MGILQRKRPADKSEADRQKVINYKKFFSSEDGKDVIIDLMDKYYILHSHDGSIFSEGQRSVVLYILKQANMDMVMFDKLLKGEI